jgi:hypothetical protein
MSLGHGIVRTKQQLSAVWYADEEYFLTAIEKFGMKPEDLKKTASYEDLFEIYSELQNFGFSTKYFMNMRI